MAVYADPDRDALHVRLADEAFALGGHHRGRVLPGVRQAARRRRAVRRRRRPPRLRLPLGERRLRPGRHRRRADLDRPAARSRSATSATRSPPATSPHARAHRWCRGTADPVTDADEVVAFAEEYGLPIAIKAAFGGGGRGMKVARTIEEIPELFDSAVREAVAAFGRGECFVEQYLDKPAPRRDPGPRRQARQRRRRVHPRLLAAAPPPEARRGGARAVPDRRAGRADLQPRARRSARRPATTAPARASSWSAQDGTISFLEVNTRLQVEHPVTEEISGIDLVREQFRIADGEELGYDDPPLRGHSFEFRINGEDPGRNFLPAPGGTDCLAPAGRPGRPGRRGLPAGRRDRRQLRLAAGQADRHRRTTAQQALERSRRALAEFEVEGIATAITVPPRGGLRPGLRTG